MNREAVVIELVKIARELVAIEFPTQDAYDKYMKEHPDADKSLHRVVETKKEAPAKEEKTERKPAAWKKKQLDLPIGKQLQYKSEGYTIDLNIAPSEDQGHPGSNIVSIRDKNSYLSAKKFKSVKEAEDYVEELKKKIEKGESPR